MPPARKILPDPEPDEEESEPCIESIFQIAEKLIGLAEKCEKTLQFPEAVVAYNSAVQTLVTAHQLNDQVNMRQAYYEAQQARQDGSQQSPQRQQQNKRDFPYMDGEQE